MHEIPTSHQPVNFTTIVPNIVSWEMLHVTSEMVLVELLTIRDGHIVETLLDATAEENVADAVCR
jgi:hypothetical protein